MFSKILIANRGEIACRIARTAKRMGINTVAVYSEIDARAKHVEMCDEAYLIGPASAKESYLNIDKILQVTISSGAQAIHPGYGFLSESADFAEACENIGIVFIGSPASAIRLMGSKSQSKNLMEKAEVPLMPGYHGEDQTDFFLKSEAEKIGYPLLIKASAGGGGKGMRVVNSAEEFEQKLLSCRRESTQSFADDRLLLEKYLPSSRHVEIQVFADTHGNVVTLFERDCSIQRRFQKVLEEAPAPGLSQQLRQQMRKVVVSVTKAIEYVGAGTVEFLLQPDGSFYFMEMNTRLQVEHPVTEMICDQDLVQWQLLVAAGEPLPLSQSELNITGHAIEVRIYAEDTQRDFMPATGQLTYLKLPEQNKHVRVDSGVRMGDAVSIYYDSMIAKLIVWDISRELALCRMRKTLADFQVMGLKTNLSFLRLLCSNKALENVELDTHFIKNHESELLINNSPMSNEVVASAALFLLSKQQTLTSTEQALTSDPNSPWGNLNGWRMNLDKVQQFEFQVDDELLKIVAHYQSNGDFLLQFNEAQYLGKIKKLGKEKYLIVLDDHQFKVMIQYFGQKVGIIYQHQTWELKIHDSFQHEAENTDSDRGLTAPMPGSVIDVKVSKGEWVDKGAELMVIEAMKMEHTITAIDKGVIETIYFNVGDQVEEGDELVSLSPDVSGK